MDKNRKVSGSLSRDGAVANAVPHNRLTYDDTEMHAAMDVLRAGQWAGGPAVAKLERALAAKVGRHSAVAVSSGVSALRLTLIALGVGSGDEVVVPAYSCVALATAARAIGARVVPVDVVDVDWNIDVDAVVDVITPKTKAVIAVNTFGSPVTRELFERVSVPVVEDCAHGFAAHTDEGLMGSRGNASVLSFYATKLMGAGEGGAVLANDQGLAGRVTRWRSYTDQDAHEHRLNDKMTDVEAALALCQLRRLDEMVTSRTLLAHRYHEALHAYAAETGAFRVPVYGESRVWYRYTIELSKPRVSELIIAMHQRGVAVAQPVTPWQHENGNTCPVADRAFNSLVSLPLYPTLTHEEQDRVISALKESIQVINA